MQCIHRTLGELLTAKMLSVQRWTPLTVAILAKSQKRCFQPAERGHDADVGADDGVIFKM